jgi:uncharacterized protein YjbI with pentapeptide repeats
MTPPDAVQAPDLPELEIAQLPPGQEGEDLELHGALVEREAGEPLRARRVRIRESELRGVVLDAQDAPGLELIDVVLADCGLSNVDGREGLIRRVEVARSRLVGFGLSKGKVQDLRVVDCTMELASFALAGLQNVVFERVNLTDASFMEARLEGVELPGADRGPRAATTDRYAAVLANRQGSQHSGLAVAGNRAVVGVDSGLEGECQ